MTQQVFRRKRMAARVFSLLICMTLAFTMAFAVTPPIEVEAATISGYGGLITTQPILVVTGSSVAKERAYTLEELEVITTCTSAGTLYSVLTHANNMWIGEGVFLDDLTNDNGLSSVTSATFKSAPRSGQVYAKTLDLSETRNYYPGIINSPPDDDYPESVDAMLAWKTGRSNGSIPPTSSLTSHSDTYPLRLLYGQTDIDDINYHDSNNAFVQSVNKMIVGSEITSRLVTIAGSDYTRADILLLPYSVRDYSTEGGGGGGGSTPSVRGVPLAHFLQGRDESTDIEYTTTDNRPGTFTVKQAVEDHYILAYENAASGGTLADLTPLSIYRDGQSRLQNIDTITISSGSGPTPPGPTGPDQTGIGDATKNTAELTITGAVKTPGYFTISGLQTWPGVTARTLTYHSRNSYGTDFVDNMTGVYLEDLLKNVMQMNSNAASVTVTASDGFERSFNLDKNKYGVYWADQDGNKIMLAWEENSVATSGGPRLVVGQETSTDESRSNWVSRVAKITVNAKTVVSGGGTVGKYESELAEQNKDDAAGGGGSGAGEVPTVTVGIEADVTVDNGTANASNTSDEVKDALADLNKEAKGDDAIKLLQLDATTDDDTDKTVYTLPPDALGLLTGDGNTGVELVTDQGIIIFSAELLKYLDENGSGALVIEIENIETADGLAAVDITIKMGDKVISSFNGIMLKADIPLDIDNSTQPDGLIVYHVSDDGQKTLIKLAAYDSSSKSMKLCLSHLSQYSVEYNPVTFADIQTHWGKGPIEFLASRSIVNGRSSDVFDPNGNVTRAEFVKMLAESVDDVSLAGAANSGFSDVPGGAWYAGYVNWAAGLGIVQGNPDGTFQPDGLITREQMAVMTLRYIQAMKFELKTVQKAAEFRDQAQISSYAASSVKGIQQYGIMGGNPDGSFNPQGLATRAESAKVMQTFIEAVLL